MVVNNYSQAQERLLIAHVENARCKCRKVCLSALHGQALPCPMIGIDAVLKAVPHSAFDVDVSTYYSNIWFNREDANCIVALWSGSILTNQGYISAECFRPSAKSLSSCSL